MKNRCIVHARSAAMAAAGLFNFLLVLAAGLPVLADESSPARAASAWQGGWKAGMAPGTGPSSSCDVTVLVVAYAALWLILLLYVAKLASQVRTMGSEMEELRRELEETGKQ